MHHNFVSVFFQEYAIKNLALLQMQEYFYQFPAYQTLPTSAVTNSSPSISSRKGGAREMAWQEPEDSILITYVKSHGAKNWSKIAKKINSEIYSGNECRKGKHCRERWFNHLDPEMKKSEWTAEEDEILYDLQRKHGNAWSMIAKVITGRTENSVRNRWNSLHKKTASKRRLMGETNEEGSGDVKEENKFEDKA